MNYPNGSACLSGSIPLPLHKSGHKSRRVLAHFQPMTSSVGYCQRLKEQHYMGSVNLSFTGRRGAVKCWVGACHRDTETLTLSAAYTHAQTMGGQPPGFEMFWVRKSQSANAPFCILDVWLDLPYRRQWPNKPRKRYRLLIHVGTNPAVPLFTSH